MPEIEIRSAIASDIPYLVKINHNYTSERVWQMEVHRDENQMDVVFREVRLPRSVQVRYPLDYLQLPDYWSRRSVILVALRDGMPIGYLGLIEELTPKAIWITDFAIAPKYRRQGIGTALVMSAKEWAYPRRGQRLAIGIQPKNYPAICFVRKMGFDFCGYQDKYYENGDIALFFEKWNG